MSGDEAQAVRYAVTDAVATLTMDQPHNRNALTPALMAGLAQGLEAALADEAVGVIVLTNHGPAFCAGADLSGGSPAGPAGGKRRTARRDGLADLLAAIQDSTKPVVARIAGHCMGGGVGLAAACDISIAEDMAKFGFTEVRVGVAPAIISVVCLPKLRRADALELFLSGERISAARAAEVGLITRAVPAADLDGEVVTVVGKLLAGRPVGPGRGEAAGVHDPRDGPGGGVHPDHRGLPGAVRLGRGRRGDGRLPGEAAPVLGAASPALRVPARPPRLVPLVLITAGPAGLACEHGSTRCYGSRGQGRLRPVSSTGTSGCTGTRACTSWMARRYRPTSASTPP